MNSISKKDSQAITVIRYPLIILVVMIHSYYGELNHDFYQLPLFKILTYDLLPKITMAAVPTFFFISGFLFFKGKDFSKSTYIGKMKRRARTLLKPYLFWNMLIIALLFLVQLFKPDFQPLTRKAIADFNITDFLSCFYNLKYINPLNTNGPIDSPLWYLRNLIFISLITPLIHLFIKKKITGAISLFVIFIISCLNIIPDNNLFQTNNILFFSLGGYISLHCSSIASLCEGKKALLHIAVYIVSLIITEKVDDGNEIIFNVALTINITSLTFILFSIAEKFRRIADRNAVKIFSKSTFFVYCYHTIVAGAVYVIIKRGIFLPTSDAASIAFFFAAVAIICLLGTGLYCLKEKLKGLFPSNGKGKEPVDNPGN